MAEVKRKLSPWDLVTGVTLLGVIIVQGVALNGSSERSKELSAQVSTLTSEVATLERENTDLESDLSDSQQRGDACLRQSQAYGEAAYNYGSLLVWLLGDSPVGPTPDMSLGTSAMARGNAVVGCN